MFSRGRNRRRHERVRLAFDGELTCHQLAHLGAADGIEWTVLDHSAGGARLVREVSEPVPDEIVLRLALAEGGGRVDVLGRVRRRIEDEGSLEIGVEYEELERVFPRLPKGLWRFFNRRGMVRALHPRELQPKARCVAPGLSSEVRLRDVSPDGGGLLMRRELAARLEFGTRIRVRFELPEHEEEFLLDGDVVHVSKVPAQALCGVAWSEERSKDFERRSEELRRYSMSFESERR